MEGRVGIPTLGIADVANMTPEEEERLQAWNEDQARVAEELGRPHPQQELIDEKNAAMAAESDKLDVAIAAIREEAHSKELAAREEHRVAVAEVEARFQEAVSA